MMRRIRAGWALTKKSWALLKRHPALLRFPLYAALVALLPLIVLALPGLYLIDTESTVAGIVLAVVGVYLAIFVGYYFSVGLAAAADATFRGEEPTMGRGLRVARQRVGPIAGWALTSVIVGAIFVALDNIRGVGPIVRGLVGAAWSLVTFMAVPVIAFEGTGPVETLKRSTALFRERWVGQVTGTVTIGGIVYLVGFLPAVALAALGVVLWASDGNGGEIAGGAVLFAVGVVLGVLSILLVRALSGVFGVALYRFARDGSPAGDFTADELQGAVAPR
jgi:Family of unknown function (DUF6159)